MTVTHVDSQSTISSAIKFQILFFCGAALFLAVLTANPARAQVGDGILGYRWIAGPSAGYEVTERQYQSRKIAAEIYLVNWHDSENSDYVNLVIDLNEMVVHGSALAAYDSETPFAFLI